MTLPALLVASQWFFLAYLVLVHLAYFALDAISIRVIGREVEASAASLLPAAFSGLEPPITLVVPAYNEEATIAAALWSMLQLEYPSFEIVVVNDGSRDRTLEVLVREFDLRPFPEAYRVSLPTRPVRGIYRAARFPTLRVIDKENGGKADALNAGTNAARCPLVCVVDADSVLQRDSLQRIVRPLMEDPTIVACGGTIRPANGCRVSEGFMERVDLPRGWLARIQVVEYLRAFLFGRMGWSPLNALLIISGAFGVFRKEALIEAGGYRTGTVGEDMELVVRLHRRHRLARKPYRIVFVPDPICWTEAPESLRVLRGQRMRWQRGLLESLAANRQLLFHPRGGAPGWLAFPVLLLFEGIAPVVELAGWALLLLATLLGGLSGWAFLAYLLAAGGMALLLSVSALLLEEMSFHLYERPRQSLTLLAAIVLENLGYRQLTTWWRLQAVFLWLARRPGRWGAMERSASWQADRKPPA
jgi:cellulose synthase/poly-beta-1,6-N-acetylglucosamine synthase-like glycosyltransferase